METTAANLDESTSERRKSPDSATHEHGEQEGEESHLAAAEAGSRSPARSASGSASPLTDYVSTRCNRAGLY